jgi:general stress protein CsbA
MFPYLFLAFYINLSKFLVVLFSALTIHKYVDIIYKAYYAYTKSEALTAFKEVCVIK